ncbi:MAG TPA: nuclear transport factor 2 family protein [Sphingobium sp.]|uniref:YybH family protein n=1 Tax=Sphingobium sp. TaxID=1912891 RepID=UPI002ED3E33E
MNPEKTAESYFVAIRAKDIDALSALYAEDATFTLPNGKQFAGVTAIRDMHAGVFAHGSPTPTPLAMVVGDRSIAVEIEAKLPDGSARRTANIYHLTETGQIQRLSVYMQG